MDTMIKPGFVIEDSGFIFVKTQVGIDISTSAGLVAVIPTLAGNGVNYVRTVQAMEEEIAFWLKDNA